jgi:HpcH/HpaI aldolase/citrate lyase family protein
MSGASPWTAQRSRTASPDAQFVFTLWTADPVLAREADDAGVDRIGVDLERLGKEQRQHGLGTWLSPHRERDLRTVGAALERASLFARLNPLHDGTPREVEVALEAGTRVLMLPMVLQPAEAERFVDCVRGRAETVLLVEHIEGIRRLERIAAVPGVDEIHIGLNDLALSLGMPNRWLVLEGNVLVDAGRAVRAAGLRFGVGGIGRVDDTSLPVPSDLVYAQYARTGATAALISRSFLDGDEPVNLARAIADARARLALWSGRDEADLEAARAELGRAARAAAGW